MPFEDGYESDKLISVTAGSKTDVAEEFFLDQARIHDLTCNGHTKCKPSGSLEATLEVCERGERQGSGCMASADDAK